LFLCRATAKLAFRQLLSARKYIVSYRNSYAYDEQGVNLGHEKEGSTVSSINRDHCWRLD